MKLKIYFLIITSLIHFTCGQFSYELEFMTERVFSPCEDYPDNSMDSIFDMTNCNIEQTEDGSLVVNGYSIIKTTVEEPLPVTIEIFKKERGTWQPTIYTAKRSDACLTTFSKSEVWYSYFENTPEEQRTCPFVKGKRLDFDINEPTIVSLPIRNGEGEYKIHVMAGPEGEENVLCFEIFTLVHKI